MGRPRICPAARRGGRRAGAAYEDLGPSGVSLIFDTETTTDPGQALRVGC